MRNTNKGFTLVELIVVITILAILGTIAFISLGSYTADARNSTRLDGISKIATAVDNGLISGTSILAYVADSVSRVTSASAGWVTLTAGTDYEAGNINASALNVNADQFKDPQGQQGYKLGATTKGGNRFQVAASLEEGANRKAAVKGTYTQRSDTANVDLTYSSGSTTVTLADVTDINFFKQGDTLATFGAITNISSDGVTLTVTTGTTGTGSAANLAAAESTGLIGSVANLALPATDNSTANLPY